MLADRTIPELTKDAASQLGDMFRNEVRLARAETMDNLRGVGDDLFRMGLGIALAAAAVTLALFALAYGLAEALPMWAASLIAAVLGGAIAFLLIKSGRHALKPQQLAMPRTTQQVANDINLIKEKVSP